MWDNHPTFFENSSDFPKWWHMFPKMVAIFLSLEKNRKPHENVGYPEITWKKKKEKCRMQCLIQKLPSVGNSPNLLENKCILKSWAYLCPKKRAIFFQSSLTVLYISFDTILRTAPIRMLDYTKLSYFRWFLH